MAACLPSILFNAVQSSVRVARGAPTVLLPAGSEASYQLARGRLCWHCRHGEVELLWSKTVIDKVLGGSGSGIQVMPHRPHRRPACVINAFLPSPCGLRCSLVPIAPLHPWRHHPCAAVRRKPFVQGRTREKRVAGLCRVLKVARRFSRSDASVA